MQSKPHTTYNEETAVGDIGRIKDAYKKYGRNEAKVTKRLVQLPNGRVDLVFTIDEGGKTGIREIKFVGNHAVSNYRLGGLMQTSTMNLLSFIKSTDVYDPDRLASDEEAIRRYYMKNGYADFRIVSTDVTYQENPPGYIITITMDEGPQYHVSSVNVVSNIPKVDGPALAHLVALRPGDVYDASAIDKSVEAITRNVATQGYAFSEARPHGERDTVNHNDCDLVLGRQRPQSLHRAHRHCRQYADTRLRHSPRIRYRRRRPLQSRVDRARRAPPQQPWLLQEGPHLEPARVGP